MKPADIENIEFTATRLKAGYDPDEVDNFLDRVAAALSAKDRELDDLRNEQARQKRAIAELNRQLADYSDLPTAQIPMNAARILEAAQKTADDVITQAQQQAEDLVREARDSARQTVTEAEAKASATLNEARAKARQTEAEMTNLQERKRDIQQYLTAQLTALTGNLETHE